MCSSEHEKGSKEEQEHFFGEGVKCEGRDSFGALRWLSIVKIFSIGFYYLILFSMCPHCIESNIWSTIPVLGRMDGQEVRERE